MSRRVEWKRLVKSALPACFVVLVLWFVAWIVSVGGPLKSVSQQPVGDAFNSLNALFAGLAFVGVLTTIIFQLVDQAESTDKLRETAEANQRTMQAATDKAVLDMFQTFCSPYFQEVKSASHQILIHCMVSRRYRDFVVSRLFVVDQLDLDEGLKDWLSRTYGAASATDTDGNLSKERLQRYKLDELMNFFSLLSVQHCSADVVKRCDFAYPWWRPLFWEIALTQLERYQASEVIQTIASPPPASATSWKGWTVFMGMNHLPGVKIWKRIWPLTPRSVPIAQAPWPMAPPNDRMCRRTITPAGGILILPLHLFQPKQMRKLCVGLTWIIPDETLL